MTGPLLKSATLKTYHPVGAVGHPVYLAAAQLRAAIARRLGPEIADIFAIPQRNEDGDSVDWYAPNPGTVVPWSAATEAERGAAQARLLEVRERIEDLGRSMESEVSSERQVFGRLLAQAMQFPGEQDVHLVNGQPVLTFWGFVKDRAEVGADPLRDLSLHLAPRDAAGQQGRRGGSGAATDVADRGRPWWLWLLLGLLLLLLIALLLWGLRGCAPWHDPSGSSDTSAGPASSSEQSVADPAELSDLGDEPLQARDEILRSDADSLRSDEVRIIEDARVDQDAVRTSVREQVERIDVGDAVSSLGRARSDITTLETLTAEDLLDADAVDADLRADQALVDDRRIDARGTVEEAVDAGATPLAADADLPLQDPEQTLAEDALDVGVVDALAQDGEDSSGLSGDEAQVLDADVGQGQEDTDAPVSAEPLGDADAADPLDAGAGIEGTAAEVPMDSAAEPGPESESASGKVDDGEGADETASADDAVALDEASAAGAEAGAPAGAGAQPAEGTDAASAGRDARSDAAADEGAPSASPQAAADARSAAPSAPESGNGASESAADSAARAASASPGAATAPAVRIPPRELLNSGWRTSRTLQDPRDGSPVHLDYRLQDGAGTVRLIRKDGSVCQSDAKAGVRDGRLVVDSQQDIVCADGTNFGRPQLDCTPKAGGQASCVGRYADGSSLPIEMQRQSE